MSNRARILTFLTVLLSACGSTQQPTMPPDTGPALAIRQPPSGSLSQAQLTAIAADIRHLQARPLAAGAQEARSRLFQWIAGSPDVHVTLCGAIAGALTGSRSPYKQELFMQYMLSSAAYTIEHPQAEAASVHVGGLEGALETYRILLGQQGGRAKDSFLDRLAARSAAGTLDDYVAAEC